MDTTKNPPLKLANTTIEPGEKITLALTVLDLYSFNPLHLPVYIMHGKRKGPCFLILSGFASHEYNGIFALQGLQNLKLLKPLHGTLIAIPVTNLLDFITQPTCSSNILTQFPGLKEGNFYQRQAFLLTQEIISKASFCLLLGSGESHFHKLPQVSADAKNEKSYQMAKNFGAPLISHVEKSAFTISQEGKEVPWLLYEGGEAFRYDELSVKLAIKGIIKIMRTEEMLPFPLRKRKGISSALSEKRVLISSPASGLLQILKKQGTLVKEKDEIASVTDPFGTGKSYKIIAPFDGIISGHTSLPLVSEGREIIEIAKLLEQ